MGVIVILDFSKELHMLILSVNECSWVSVEPVNQNMVLRFYIDLPCWFV